MAKIKKYWIRYNAGADRIEQTVTESRHKPQGFGWTEVDVNKCCDSISGCSEPVLFSCIDSNFYIEFINPENGMITGIYTGEVEGSYEEQIPRGTYDVYIYSVPTGQSVFINDELIGVGDGSDIVLLGYDTTQIRQLGYCMTDGTQGVTDFLLHFTYNQGSSEEDITDLITSLVQFTLKSADGTEIIAQSEIGGPLDQTFNDLPIGEQYQVCIDVINTNPNMVAFITPFDTQYGGTFLALVAASPAGETCSGGGNLLTIRADHEFRVATGGQGLG